MGQSPQSNEVLSAYLKILKTLVVGGIPDTRWGSLLLYFREIKDYSHLSEEQKGQVQQLLTDTLKAKDFSDSALDILLEEYRRIVVAPCQKHVEELARQAETMLTDFHGLTQTRYKHIENLETETVSMVESSTDPQQLIVKLQEAFLGVKKQLKSDMESLEKLAFRDTLTNVGNRRAFDRFMDEVIPRWKNMGIPLSMAMFDVDFFKRFNDTYGHSVGDQVLKLVGKYLNRQVAKLEKKDNMALAARYGGEEFLLVVSGPEARLMPEMADELRNSIRSFNFILRDNTGNVLQSGLQVTVSGGVVVCRSDWGDCQDTMLEHADRALYHAKNNGRDRVYVYNARADSGYKLVEPKADEG